MQLRGQLKTVEIRSYHPRHGEDRQANAQGRSGQGR